MMHKHRQLWHGLRAEHGSQGLEAAGAALAAALLVLALLFGARTTLGPSVERAFECAAAALGAGGADCGGGGAAPTTPENTSEAPPAEEEEEDCGFFCTLGNAGKQVLGVGKGIGEGAVDLVKGVWTLGSDAFKAATGDQATRDKYAGLVDAFRENPWETTKALAGAVVEPIVTDWKAGRYGEAIGRGIFEGAGVIFGPKGVDKVGKLGKLDDIARVADRADDVTDTARTIDRLPCVGVAPAGKGPGLAKPLTECKTTRRTNIETQHLDDVRRLGGDIDYGSFDALGRPTGIRANITRDMIGPNGTGSEPLSSIRPPGFDSAQGHARGHLLGDQLGGSGKVDSNLVTLYQDGPNTPVMRGFETQVRRSIETGPDGYWVEYTATPIYNGNDPVPIAVTITAKGHNGGAHNMDLAVTIINKP